MKPLISVIIPTRNRKLKLKQAIDRLISQLETEIEIVVVDAASTDGTVEILREYGDRVRWLSERDKGEYDARNKGIRMAKGEILHFAGDDNLIHPQSFVPVIDHFERYQDTDILFGGAYHYHEDAAGVRTFITDKINVQVHFSPRVFIRGTWPTLMSDSVFMRRRTIDRLGEFDTVITGGDYEYWARAAHEGLIIRQEQIHVLDYILSPDSAVMKRKTEHAVARLTIARRYGTLSDVLYIALFLVPEQFIVDQITKYLPLPMTRALRKMVWYVKSSLFKLTI